VDIAGAESVEWQEAARSLAASGLTDQDCASIRLDVIDGGGARLTFITLDGRRAERRLASPDELHPTVEALCVTGPDAEQPVLQSQPLPQSHPERIKDTSPAASRTKSASAGSTAPAPSADDFGAIFALRSGARGGADALLSPVLTGSAALMLQRWELGVMAAWEILYFDLQNQTPSDRESGAMVLGVAVGRREPLAGVAVLAGGRLSIAMLTQYSCDSAVSAPAEESAAVEETCDRGPTEWRVGAYLGVALPREGGLRFRADLEGDLVGMDGPATTASPAERHAITPAWAVTCLLGVEVGG
jgi:hypothetical protein